MVRRLTMVVALAGAVFVPMASFALPAGTLLAQAGATRILLEDGTVVEGEITSMTADEIVVATPQGTQTISRARVTRIDFGAASAATPAPPATPAATPPGATPPPPQPTPPPEGWATPGTGPTPAPTPSSGAPAPATPPGETRVPQGFRGHPAFVLNGFLGGKTLNSDWEPVGGQAQIGVEMTFLPLVDLPLGFALDASFASGNAPNEEPSISGTNYTASTAQLDAGIRFMHEIDPHLPIVVSLGGGVSSVSASFQANDSITDEVIFEDGDSGVGVWGSAGVHVRLLEYLNIGATMRWTSSTVVLFDRETDPGGLTFGAVAGFSFGFPSQYGRSHRRVIVKPARPVPPPAPGAREMWLTTPWGGQQYIAVGQWVLIERSDGPPVSGRVNRLFPDAVELDTSGALVRIPTSRILRISAR